jgi:PAS domain S-box-containing protein
MKKSILNRQSQIFILILGILVLISISILSFMNANDQINDHDFIIDSYKRLNAIDNLALITINSLEQKNIYFEFGDKESLVKLQNLKTKSDSILKKIRTLSLEDSQQLNNAEQLILLFSEQYNIINSSINTLNKKTNRERTLKNNNEREKVINLEINSLLDKMRQRENGLLEINRINAESRLKFSSYTISAGIVISVIIFSVLFILVFRNKGKSDDEYEISREELEQIVRDRTAEISQINNKLYKKINELEKKDGELRKSFDQYLRLFEQAHDAIILINPENGKIINVNRRACDLYGFSKEEFKQISLRTISKNINSCLENIKQTLEKGYYHNFQSVHYKKDLSEMLMEINASVFEYNGNKVILSINRDITERILKIPVN